LKWLACCGTKKVSVLLLFVRQYADGAGLLELGVVWQLGNAGGFRLYPKSKRMGPTGVR
jgi:hypothetical protein